MSVLHFDSEAAVVVGEAFLLQSSVLEEVEVGVMGTELLLLPATSKLTS